MFFCRGRYIPSLVHCITCSLKLCPLCLIHRPHIWPLHRPYIALPTVWYIFVTLVQVLSSKPIRVPEPDFFLSLRHKLNRLFLAHELTANPKLAYPDIWKSNSSLSLRYILPISIIDLRSILMLNECEECRSSMKLLISDCWRHNWKCEHLWPETRTMQICTKAADSSRWLFQVSDSLAS